MNQQRAWEGAEGSVSPIFPYMGHGKGFDVDWQALGTGELSGKTRGSTPKARPNRLAVIPSRIEPQNIEPQNIQGQ